MKILAFSGKAHSGKDTLAKHIIQSNPVLEPYSFADPIKDVCDMLFGWDMRHREGELKEVVDPRIGVSPRHAYQTLGTEWGRNLINPNIWLKIADDHLNRILNSGKIMVLSDLRFINEVEWVMNNGGRIVSVTRPGYDGIGDEHESEKYIDQIRDRYANHVIVNSGTVEDLYNSFATTGIL